MNVPPRGNDDDHVLPIDIRAEGGAVVLLGISHIGPVEMSSNDVNHQSTRYFSSFVDDLLQIGSVPVSGEHSAATGIQKKEPAGLD